MAFYRRAISYFRDDVQMIVASLLLIVVMKGLELLQAFPLAIFIDLFFHPAHESALNRWFEGVTPTQDRSKQVIILAVATLVLGVVKEGLQMFQKLLDIRVGYNGLMRVRCDLFRKLQELSLGYHRSQPQGDAIYRLSWDTFGFQTVLNFVTGTLINAVTLIGMIAIMLAMEWKLTLVALVIVPLLLWAIKHYARVLRDRSTESKEVEAQLMTSIQRSVASIGLVQAFGKEPEEYQRFHSTVQNTVRTNMKMHWQEVMFWLVLGSIFTLGTALMFGYGGVLVVRGELTVGALTIFLQYLGKLYDPLNKLTGGGATLQSGAAGVRRVFEVLDRDLAIADAPNALPLPVKPRQLEFDHVSFEYRNGEPVLRDVNARIAAGEMVAFVGSSGVGKTTLLNLLPRFYDPTEGALRLDGIDAHQIKVRDLRKHIALVLQENVILPTSVAENIAYGRPDASDAQIRAAAAMAGADGFIEKLPQKYDTQVSESGQNLSGGQRQRIAIARALITEAPIIVLDEPTSALDPQNEQMITQTLRSLKGKRTMILVSHRLSTVADCDQIFVMENGQIVERGTHDELVAKRGVYFAMAKHQMKLEGQVVASGT